MARPAVAPARWRKTPPGHSIRTGWPVEFVSWLLQQIAGRSARHVLWRLARHLSGYTSVGIAFIAGGCCTLAARRGGRIAGEPLNGELQGTAFGPGKCVAAVHRGSAFRADKRFT